MIVACLLVRSQSARLLNGAAVTTDERATKTKGRIVKRMIKDKWFKELDDKEKGRRL